MPSVAKKPQQSVTVVAKIVALRPVLGGGSEWLWLALVAAVNIALGIAVYLRWLAVVVAAPAAQKGAVEAREGDEPAREARHTPLPVGVLVGLLTALLVAGSIVPLGIV